ncbi:hypothetical protein IV102_25980 [bacterium]|nr:hypothetical protein [bacterium]
MHSPPVVDANTLELLRRRLAWGLLGLEQPANDLVVALQHFAYRWNNSQPPPTLLEWQSQLLESWRQRPQACAEARLDPVLETMVTSLRLEHGQSLDGWFSPVLFELARNQVEQADLKPVLRHSWQQLSLGVQRLRQGAGAFSSEGEGALRGVLQALQQVQLYFQNPDVKYLEEAGWRWSEAIEEWNGVANLCLSGLQPATAAIQWGKLAEILPLDEAQRARIQRTLAQWFQGWSCDFVHTLAPYQHQILGMEPAVHDMGMALLRWQKLLPGWQSEVGPTWAKFLATLPASSEGPPAVHIFRWLEPQVPIEERFLQRNPWRGWLKKAGLGPPTGVSKKEGERLQDRLRLGRLFSTLVQDCFVSQGVPFPEHSWAHEAGEWLASWLEGYDPLAIGAISLLEERFGQMEQLLLRDFPVPGRTTSPNVV